MSDQAPSEATPPAIPTPPRPMRRALIAGAAIVVLGIGGFLAYFIPTHLTNASAGAASDPTKTGCPSAAAPPHWATATTTVTDKQEGMTIQAHVGDTVDFVLPANKFTWTYVAATDRAVQVQSPGGYYDPARTACVWRLKPSATGTNILTFQRRMLCPPHATLICSDIVISWRYVLNTQ